MTTYVHYRLRKILHYFKIVKMQHAYAKSKNVWNVILLTCTYTDTKYMLLNFVVNTFWKLRLTARLELRCEKKMYNMTATDRLEMRLQTGLFV